MLDGEFCDGIEEGGSEFLDSYRLELLPDELLVLTAPEEGEEDEEEEPAVKVLAGYGQEPQGFFELATDDIICISSFIIEAIR